MKIAEPSSHRRTGAGGFELHFSATTGQGHVPFLRRHLQAAHRLLKPPLRELSVALVGDRTMSRLHEQYMGESGPTDVLTFELEHDARGAVTAGEVVVCVPQAVRQSRRLGHGAGKELLLYALHGMLHLMAHDDRTKRGYQKMHEIEDQVLTRIGIGRAFDSSDRKGGRP